MSPLTIRPIDLDKDADGLADMWNASDMEWPWSLTDGVPVTAEMVRKWELEQRLLVAFVAEVDGEIAGYCSFMSNRYREGEGMLALLNVRPHDQNRSIGRRLVQATIERSVEMGWSCQSLGTWSGNLKAMPAYKKTGHYWRPDTSAWMQSFIPGALQLSLAKPFFERHDWYDSYVREVTQEADDDRWEGLRVFTQHWEAEGESLTIWIDQGARAPVAVETDALQVATIAEDVEPLAGSTVNLRWRVINKGKDPLRVNLHALGDKGLEIDHREAFAVAGGETVERAAPVKVADDAIDKKDDGTAPSVRSIIRLNDEEVELYSGLRAKKPLSLDTAPAQVTVCPGIASVLPLQLHSEMNRDVDVTLHVTPSPGLALEWSSREVCIPAKGHLSVPVQVTSAGEAVYALSVRAESSNDECKAVTEDVTIFSLSAGGLLFKRGTKSVRLETDALRVTFEAKEGRIAVEHKPKRLVMARLSTGLGPPYHPSEFSMRDFDLTVEERGARAVVRMSAEAKHYAGLYLHQEFALSPSGLGTLRCYLENRGSQAHSKRVRLSVRSASSEREWMTLPLLSGIVRSRKSSYPVAWEDAPSDAAGYAEPWLAWECEGVVAGIAWGPSIARVAHEWTSHLTSCCLDVKPGQRSQEVCIAVYAGPGGWRDMRQVALTWAGLEPSKKVPLVRPPALARLEPAVMATVSDQVEGRLVVDTVSSRVMSGQVSVVVEDGLVADPSTFPVVELRRGRSLERPVLFGLPSEGSIFRGQVRLELPVWREESVFHVIRLGLDAPVKAEEDTLSGQRVWRIGNGAAEFVVAPGFGPSMIAWNQDGGNQLLSAFPDPQGFFATYPWFGGIHPLLIPAGSECREGFLHREMATPEPVTAEDAMGIPWRGVRLGVRPDKKELHDLRIEIDYLTLGKAKVLKYVCRLQNLRDTEQKVRAGSTVACRLGAEAKDLVLRGEGVVRKPTPYGTLIDGMSWGALTNPRTGKTMLTVGRGSDVLLRDWGQNGRVLGSTQEVRLAGKETRELVYYLVLCDTLEEAQGYLVLRDYCG